MMEPLPRKIRVQKKGLQNLAVRAVPEAYRIAYLNQSAKECSSMRVRLQKWRGSETSSDGEKHRAQKKTPVKQGLRLHLKSQKKQVPEAGLEPARVLPHWILNPARLPFRHSGNGAISWTHIALSGIATF